MLMTKKNTQPLVKDSKYQGQYVAFASSGNDIIASGKNPSDVIDKARKQGIDVPSIAYVPKEGIISAY